MKKFFKMMLALLVFVPCIVFVGCNGNKPASITKAQYAKAFGDVQTTFEGGSSEAFMSTGYKDATHAEDSMAYTLVKFIKLIMQNDSYVLTNDMIEYTSTIPDGYGSVAKIRQRLTYDGTNIVGMLGMADDFDNGTYFQSILFSIEYDFGENVLKGYEINVIAKMTYSDEYYYDSVIYDGEKVMVLDVAGGDIQTITSKINSDYEKELAKSIVNKNYDFSDELAAAQGI